SVGPARATVSLAKSDPGCGWPLARVRTPPPRVPATPLVQNAPIARPAAHGCWSGRGGACTMNSAWLPYLRLIRAPAVFTAISNIVAAHLVAASGVIEWGSLAALVLASCALLAAGMVLNDCFDQYVDARTHPKRPLPSRAVPALT